MQTILGWLRPMALVVMAFVAPLHSASAFPVPMSTPHGAVAKPLLVHGFHCRPYFGWDPVAGVYQQHSHPGICEDYQRCLKVSKRCIFIHGRGFDKWTYERWGWDNWRYSSCMIKHNCY